MAAAYRSPVCHGASRGTIPAVGSERGPNRPGEDPHDGDRSPDDDRSPDEDRGADRSSDEGFARGGFAQEGFPYDGVDAGGVEPGELDDLVLDEAFVRAAAVREPAAAERERAARQANLSRLLADETAQQHFRSVEMRRLAPADDEAWEWYVEMARRRRRRPLQVIGLVVLLSLVAVYVLANWFRGDRISQQIDSPRARAAAAAPSQIDGAEPTTRRSPHRARGPTAGRPFPGSCPRRHSVDLPPFPREAGRTRSSRTSPTGARPWATTRAGPSTT